MRARLARLGVEGVEARTFHSAALAQLRRARGEGPGRILSTKALLLRQIGNTLPPPYRFRPAGGLAAQGGGGQKRRPKPGGHPPRPPRPPPPPPREPMGRGFPEYERRQEGAGGGGFEDLL